MKKEKLDELKWLIGKKVVGIQVEETHKSDCDFGLIFDDATLLLVESARWEIGEVNKRDFPKGKEEL